MRYISASSTSKSSSGSGDGSASISGSSSRFSLTVFLVVSLLSFSAPPPIVAAKQDPGIATSTGNTLEAPAKPDSFGAADFGKSSAVNSGMSIKSVNAPVPAKETLFSTDENTDMLERAIERFNREKCPPQIAIREVNQRNLSLLAQFRYIPSDYSRFAKMVIRDGKVFKPMNQTPGGQTNQYGNPRGEVPDSLGDMLEVVANGLDDKSPIGKGTPPPSTKTMTDERRATFRNQNGELVEFKYFVPRIPPNRTRTFTGKIIKAPVDMVKKDFLPAKYKTAPSKFGVLGGPTPIKAGASSVP